MKIPSRLERYFALTINIALLILGLIFLQYCRDGVVEYHHYVHGYRVDVVTQIALYGAAALLVVFGKTNRWTLPIIFGVALAAQADRSLCPGVSVLRHVSICLGWQGAGCRH